VRRGRLIKDDPLPLSGPVPLRTDEQRHVGHWWAVAPAGSPYAMEVEVGGDECLGVLGGCPHAFQRVFDGVEDAGGGAFRGDACGGRLEDEPEAGEVVHS
jgi:hypothetical protein